MHSTINDVLGTLEAFFLFPLIIVVPGFVLGWLVNLFKFRSLGIYYQLAIGLLVSVSCVPICVYLFAKFGGFALVWGVLGVLWLIFLFLLVSGKIAVLKGLRQGFPQHKKLIFSLLVCLLVTVFYVVDLEFNGQLVKTLLTYDYVKHTAVTNAISFTGIPPVNPSFSPGEPVQLFYYYFWFLLCSLVDMLGGATLTPRDAVMGSVLWGEILLVVTLLVFMKRQGWQLGIKPAHYKVGLLLLLVTGLDFIPAFSGYMLHLNQGGGWYLVPSIEWWNDQIAAWVSAIVWVPHYIGAFTSCLFAFMLINEGFSDQHIPEQQLPDRKQRKWPVAYRAFTVFALASSFGMSIWITVVATGILVVWMISTFFIDRRKEFLPLVMIGVSTAVLLIPFILDLYQSQSLQGAPMVITVRPFPLIDKLNLGLPTAGILLIRFLMLPINYILELGFFLLAGWLYLDYRKSLGKKATREEQFLLVMFLVSLIICTFVRSSVKNNDLGWRGFMFAQFALLLASIPVFVRLWGKKAYEKLNLEASMRYVLIGMIVLGVVSNVYEAWVLRTFSYAEKGTYGLALRKAYEWIDKTTPKDYVIQHNPAIEIDYYHALYGNRRVAVADTTLGRLYGIDNERFFAAYDPLKELYEKERSILEVKQIASAYKIDMLVVKQADRIWKDENSWVWDANPVYENEYCRIYAMDSFPE